MYKQKYIKYKQKYLHLKGGGNCETPEETKDCMVCATSIDGKNCRDKLLKNTENPLNKIERINGPNTLYYYNIPLSNTLNKKILLLGEIHNPDFNDCVSGDTCIDMIKFLDTIINLNNNKCIDFFLELTPKRTEGFDIVRFNGGGSNNNNYLMIKLRKYALELQKKNNVRVQKWDLRSGIDNTGIFNIDIKHDILLLNDSEVKFLKEYNINYTISNENNYKRNIIKILNYLIIDDTPNDDIRDMISMLCMTKYDKRTLFGTPKNLEYIILINTKLKKVNECIIGFDSYIKFLKFELKILDILKNDDELKISKNSINKMKKSEDDWEEKNPDKTVLFYNPLQFSIRMIIRNKIKIAFKEYEEDLLKINLCKDTNHIFKKSADTLTNEILVDYFYETVESEDFIYKAVENEILFYEEMSILKQKLNKSYEKFLKFCEKYPNIFGDGKNIRQDIIEIMTNEKNFNNRYNDKGSSMAGMFMDGTTQMGLNSTLTDLYTFLRMFTIFDSEKERDPIKCNNIETPEKIILYAGKAHIELYNSIFNKYKDRIESKIIIHNEHNNNSNKVKINELNINLNNDAIENNRAIIRYKSELETKQIENVNKMYEDEERNSYNDNAKTQEINKINDNFSEHYEINMNNIKKLNNENEKLENENEKLRLTFKENTFSSTYINIDNATENKIGNLKDLVDDFIN